MILRLIFTVACLQATVVSFSQTETQKQLMYEHINRDSKGSSIIGKIQPIENKEALFNNAQILPVYKVVFDKTNKPSFIQKEKYYLVFYIGRLYIFVNNKGSRLFENSPIIQNLTKFNSEKKKFKIVYFTESFSFDSEIFNPLITDDIFSYIIDKGIQYKFFDFIDFKYGSIEKLKEFSALDIVREKLTVKDINNYIKSNYLTFQYYCPKDTTLVLKSLVNEIRNATKDFSKGQELKLVSTIKQKLNPFPFFKKTPKSQKLNDSIVKIQETEIKKIIDEHQKHLSKVIGNYEFKIYGVSITNELLEIFTNKQLVDYINYNNLMRPALDTLVFQYNRWYRYSYGKEVLIKAGIIKNDSYKEFQNYSNKILEECGCPFDESIKRETIIR